MKQVLQNLRTGQTMVEEVPAPGLSANSVLIQTSASLISAGTERMLVEFSKASLIAKARSQPENVRQVLDKIKTDGLIPTLETVFRRLNEPLPLGYCNAGVVLEVGPGVMDFAPGDRVASNGKHAEIVAVPRNLCAKIPEGVTDEQAAFTVLSSIALQGIRLVGPTFGETVAVIGLGLVGLVTVQLLRANGCRVLGTDVDAHRLALAREFGCQTVNTAAGGDAVAAAMAATNGKGVDAVLVTASAKTDEIMHQAAEMCRKRGRIVLVGVVGLNLRRGDFYEKELSFQVSCSYGPGRYDDKYEQGGQDYPYGFVRWTEQRNFCSVLEAMRNGSLLVDDLITHRYPIAEAPKAYEKISAKTALGVVLQYPGQVERATTMSVATKAAQAAGRAVVGVIGAGNFSKMVMMPALSKSSARLEYIADLDGRLANDLAKKYGVTKATSDYKQILKDQSVNAVLVAVRHDLHARFVIEVLEAGKHVFVEKPLALSTDQVAAILEASGKHPDQMIMVGFNRRFSPHVVKIKQLLRGRSEPLCMNFLANPGYIPPESWPQDPEIGGGRIVGEACHYIDLMVHLTGSKVATVSASMTGKGVATREDKMSIALNFEDGSVGSVNYFANGSKRYPKEQLQVFNDNRVLELINFRITRGYGFKGFTKFKTSRQNKGHSAEFAAFVDRVAAGGESLVPLDVLVNVTLATFAAMTSAAENRVVRLDQEYVLLQGAG